MIKEGNFGYHEAISLMVITITSKVFFTSPAMLMEIVGTSGWYMTLISASTAAFAFMFLYLLLKRFPNKNLMEISDLVLGKWAGSIVSFIIGGFLLVIASMNMREFTEVLKVYVLPDSPPSFIMVLFTIGLIMLSFMGLETIARYAKFVIYILGAGYVLVVLLSIQNFVPRHLYPVLGYGLDKTIINGVLRSSFYGEIIVIGIIASSLQGPKEIKRIGFTSLLIAGLLTCSALLAFNLAFPYTIAQELTSPMYEMASLIDYGGFFQRMEPIFLFLWNFGTIIEVALLFYAVVLVYCHVFKIPDKRPILLPMAILLYSLNLIPKGISEVISGVVQYMRTWGWIIYFIPSMLILIVAVIRKKKGESRDA